VNGFDLNFDSPIDLSTSKLSAEFEGPTKGYFFARGSFSLDENSYLKSNIVGIVSLLNATISSEISTEDVSCKQQKTGVFSFIQSST